LGLKVRIKPEIPPAQEIIMKRLFAFAVLLLASPAAHAGDSYSFEIGGRTIHIDAPTGCDQPSCMSISIPGVYDSGPKRAKRAPANPQPDTQANTDPQPPVSVRTEPPVSVRTEPPVSVRTEPPVSVRTEPPVSVRTEPPVSARTEPVPAVPPSRPVTNTATATEAPYAPVSPAPAPAPGTDSTALTQPAPTPAPAPAIVATAPVSAPIQRQQVPVETSRTAPSPLGVWQTEKKEGLVRIEACGANLCGYSVNAKTNQNGEKVLINMTAANDKWTGRIHDPKSGGNYDSTIALKGPDTLRVQGCAFGGMFCGGQTWTRVN
jgi:hypothetical protein